MVGLVDNHFQAPRVAIVVPLSLNPSPFGRNAV